MTLTLPRGDIGTSSLGMGCAYLNGGWEAAPGRRLVAAALDAGYRHFDTAPVYGSGTSEAVLGSALGAKRKSITIATKAGINRPHLSVRRQLLRLAATPVRKYLRELSHKAGSTLAATKPPGQAFTVEAVSRSALESLQHLRTDYVDLFLLHDPHRGDVTDELVAYLESQRRGGAFRAIGIASSPEEVSAIFRSYPGVFDVAQYSWSVLDASPPVMAPVFTITHRAVMRAFAPMKAWLAQDQAAAERLSLATGLDMRDGRVLGQVLLGAALAENDRGLTLIGTRQRRRLLENAAVMRDDVYIQAGARLVSALRLEDRLPAVNS